MKWRSWLLVATLALGIIATLAGVKYVQISNAIAFAESFPEPSETVVAAVARNVEWQRVERSPGEVVALRTVEVKNEYSGTITEVGFIGGASVSAGQMLLSLDSREEEARLAALRARAELARLTLARNETLASTSAASRQAADTARAELDATLAEARGVQVIIDKKTLRSPFDARSGLHEWQAGQYLEAGTTVTWLVGEGDGVWIDFALPQESALGVVSDQVTVRSTRPRWRADAKIIARDPFVEPQSRNLGFRAYVDEAGPGVVAGAFVDVTVEVGDPVPAIAVPATALRRDAFGPHVYVLEPAEPGADAPYRAQRRDVELLEVRESDAFLGGGLEAGEQVASDGAFKLRGGLLVHIADKPESAR